jgi:hypothetical protein
MRTRPFIAAGIAIFMVGVGSVAARDSTSFRDSVPWRSSLYLGAGYGWPNGARFEIGGNIGWELSVGMHLTIFNNWASDPEEGMVGITIRANVPIREWPVTPYLQFLAGSQIEISFSSSSPSPDGYYGFQIGAIFSPVRSIALRPEFGVLFTNVDDYDVQSKDTYPSFHLQCDLIVFELFR